MLRLENVSANYGQIAAIRGIDIELASGRCLALLGRNGAGKSTLLKIIAGMMSPAEGSVSWNGQDVTHVSADRRPASGIVLVPEGRCIFPALSVDENLRMGAYWARPSRSEYRGRWEQVTEYFPKLRTLRKQMAGSLSGGEQQMVAVARALMASPKLLLVDEPSLGLAPMVVESLYEVFATLKSTDMTIIVVEQFVEYALGLADDVVALNKGEMVLAGSPAELIANPKLAELYMAGQAGQEAVQEHLVG